MHTFPRVLVLGIGNILWADEGFGVRAVEALNQAVEFGGNVTLLDGGTQGLYLIQRVRETDILVVLDAIDYGLTPGTLRCIEGDAVPRYLGAKKVSLHQTGFQEVLATAAMLGDCPGHIYLVGVQPEEIDDFGGSLRPSTRAMIQPAIEKVIQYLATLDIRARPRIAPLSAEESLSGAALDMTRYESERPDEHTACRIGDDRVLASPVFTVAPRPQFPESDGLRVDVDQRDFS